MFVIRKLCGLIDSINEWTGRAVAWTTLALVIVIFSDVVMRYLFNTSYVFTQELEWHIFSFIFLIGAGYTLLHDGHVRVDIIYQVISPKARAWVDLIGVLFFLIPGCYLVIKTSGAFTLSSWEVFEGSPDPGGISYRFIIKSFIPIGFSLMLLQGVSLGLKSFLVVVGAGAEERREA